MTLKFIDGFDHYDTAHLAAKWPDVGANVGGGNAGIGFGSARHGGQNFFSTCGTGSPNRYVGRAFPATTSWVIGFAFKHSGGLAGSQPICMLLDAGAFQCELRLNADASLSITRNGSAITGATSSVLLGSGLWYFIEWKVTIADAIAANSCKVRVNGADVINVPAGSDLKAQTTATATVLRIGWTSSLTGPITFYYDDLYVCDNAGTVNNDFLGDVYVETLYPIAPGNISLWTPSAAPNWSCVEEVPPNDDADYVSATIIGVRDTYTIGDLATVPPSIKGVQVSALARKTDSGARAITLVTRSGGSDYGDGPFSLGDSYAYASAVRESDPATAAPWTGAGVNAAEWGVELTS